MNIPSWARDEDYMMRQIDGELEELERRLREQYEQAQRELKLKLEKFLNKYEKKRQYYYSLVEEGTMSQMAYDLWCRNQIINRKVFEVQIDALTQDLTNVDRIANQMINGELPDVYVSSYNFGLFRGDMMAETAGYEGANFSLYNVDALRILINEDPDLIPWAPLEFNEDLDFVWNRTQLQNSITQGILQGEHPRAIADRIAPIVNNDAVAAIRTARTAFTSVENQARRDSTARIREAGIPMDEPWLATKDARTRDTHLLLDGTLPNRDGLYGEGIIPTGHLLRFPADPRGDPEQIYNCRCRVQSYIGGIDHSHDDELYSQFLQANYYDDWLQLQSSPKVDEMRAAVERQRQLRSGEREDSIARMYRRRRERAQRGG